MTIGQTLKSIKTGSPIIWRSQVGRMHARNNIVAWRNTLIFSTSGDVWNEADPKDGLLCLDAATGETKWFFPTGSDANEVLLVGDCVVCGTDAGGLFALNADTGGLEAQFKAAAPIIARAVLVSAGSDLCAVSLSLDGEVLAYSPSRKQIQSLGKVSGQFRANPVASPALAAAGSFIAASETGEILKISILEGLACQELHQIEAARPSRDKGYLLTLRGIGSLVIAGDLLIISYARNTMDDKPPIRAIHLGDGTLAWKARAVKTVSKRPQLLGNSRVTPAIWNGQVITTLGYTDSLYAYSLTTGVGLWKLRLDEGLFQNWASPLLDGDRLYAARVNGLLIKVDLSRRTLLKTLSIDFPYETRTEDRTYLKDDFLYWKKTPWPELQATGLAYSGPAVGQPLVAGLASSPIRYDGMVFVGTVSGEMCAIRDN